MPIDLLMPFAPQQRFPVRRAMLVATSMALTACAKSGPAYPQTVVFSSQTLVQGTTWTRDGMSGVVYVPAGQRLPAAALQVGAILSADHLTADALHTWVREQQRASGAMEFFRDDLGDESCTVARSGLRHYVAVEVCKTGVARALCVEADEVVTEETAMACVAGSRACFRDLCDVKATARREALDALAADLLTVR